MAEPLRLLLLSDFNLQNLRAYLQGDSGSPQLTCESRLLGDALGSLLSLASAAETAAEGAVVWTQPQAVLPAYAAFVERRDGVPLADLLSEVDAFAGAIEGLAARVALVFVPSWVSPPGDRGLGPLEWRSPHGLARTVASLNLRLAERLERLSNVLMLDTQRWLQAAGADAANPRGWFLGKMAASNAVLREAAADIKAAWRGVLGQGRKLVILDLDNTLWGGVVGEVGWEQLRLGGHDPVGEAFVAFQRGLRQLNRRGIVLALASKNDEQVALAAIERHPEMVLKAQDFAGWRINWRDKAENIAALVGELNLGLDATVFIDDHPAERARVAAALPAVLVPEWPTDPLLYLQALQRLRCFDAPALSAEDAARAALYAAERLRRQSCEQVGAVDEWLATLGIVIEIEPLGSHNLLRAAQLLNKTNQMNLSTRRLTEGELTSWAQQGQRSVWAFRLADRFGDAGLTGLLSLEIEGAHARVVDFLLSCRVLGRKLEECMLRQAIAVARDAGAERLDAVFVPTAKNGPCLEFWRQRSGFEYHEAERRFSWPTRRDFALADWVTVLEKRDESVGDHQPASAPPLARP